MRIRLFALMLLLFAAGSMAVEAQTTKPAIRWVGSLPATCNPLNASQALVYKYTATTGLYRCSATNTWTSLGGSAPSSPLTLTSTAADQVPLTIKLFAGQTANAFEIQPSGSTSPIFRVTTDGGDSTASIVYFNNSGTFRLGGHGGSGLALTVLTNKATPFIVRDSSFGGILGSFTPFNASAGGTFAGSSGAAVASAASIVPTGNLFHVTGTTNITSVTAADGNTAIAAGTKITIIFDGVLTFTDGSNLKLAGNFVTTPDDSITLVYDGTNWYETARSVN